MIIARRRESAAPSLTRDATFTGAVWSDSRLRVEDEGVIINDVFFQPSVRTNWHRHERGQILFVTHGVGLVQVRGEPAKWIGPSDVVYFHMDEEHWHGAGPDTYLLHTAISLGKSEWYGPVSPDEYSDALRSSGPRTE
jgi:quercetin dioxygenase-like cupin family protein